MFLLRNIFQKTKLPNFSLISSRYFSLKNEVEQFSNDGVVCLRGCFSKHWVNTVNRGIQKVFNNPSKYSDRITSTGGNGIYFNDYLQWRKTNEFISYIRDSSVPEIAAAFLSEEEVAFYHEQVFVKESFNESLTPWHHDQSYYPIDGWQNCSIWMPVTPVEEQASLRFIKGSHKWGKWFSPRYFETAENYVIDKLNEDQRLYETMPKIKEKEHEILAWEMEPGDCLVFHMRTVHGSLQTMSTTTRKTLVTRWLGHDATLARRPWKTSPPVRPNDITFGDFIKNSQEVPVYSIKKKRYIKGL